MTHRVLSFLMLLVMLVILTGNVQAANSTGAEPTALLQVLVPDADAIIRFAATGLPSYTAMDGFLLAGVPESRQPLLDRAGLTYRVLDADISGAAYYLAEVLGRRDTPDWEAYGRVLLSENGLEGKPDSPQSTGETFFGKLTHVRIASSEAHPPAPLRATPHRTRDHFDCVGCGLPFLRNGRLPSL